MSETRICHICGAEIGKHETCENCTKSVPVWKSPSLMTPEERIAEMYLWYNPAILEVPFNIMAKRISDLVGRPVYTHEFLDYDGLCEEILGNRERPTLEQIYESLVKRAGVDRVVLFDLSGNIGKNN